MNRIISYCLVAVCYVYVASAVDDVTIEPSLLKKWVLEGSPLELRCTAKTSENTTKPLDFYKGPGKLDLITEADGFVASTEALVDANDVTQSLTKTIKKDATTFEDQGRYTCYYGSTNSYIDIFVFKVTPVNALLVEKAPSVSLTCQSDGIDAAMQLVVEWKHGNETLTEGTKYKMYSENYTLEIFNPVRADAGEYTCVFIFEPGTTNEYRVAPRPAALKAGPKIDSHDNHKNLVEGDQLDLKCMVSGYPVPKIEWTKDDQHLNASHRVHFFPYGPSDTGKLTVYSLTFDDKGDYKCIATSEGFNETAVETMKIRVKDKLAALWPFLGIVAEVFVLCAIIFIYEKRRSKAMQDEDDSPDTNVEKPTDNKDVRHRRT